MKTTFVSMILSFWLFQCSSGPKDDIKNKEEVKDTVMVPDTAKIALLSEITCPKCAFKKAENMPTDVCLLSYTCEKCNEVMHPKDGDCCVFCTYGDKKCPSKQ